jgi:hypothetical protein
MDAALLIADLEQARLLIEKSLDTLRGQPSSQTLQSNAGIAQPKLLLERNLPSDIDFSTPARPFMKSFAGLSGARKFVLLVAWMSKGDPETQVSLSEVENLWHSMSGMLKATFNRKFTSDAKESDWVQTKKVGFYNLRPSWKEVLIERKRK